MAIGRAARALALRADRFVAQFSRRTLAAVVREEASALPFRHSDIAVPTTTATGLSPPWTMTPSSTSAGAARALALWADRFISHSHLCRRTLATAVPEAAPALPLRSPSSATATSASSGLVLQKRLRQKLTAGSSLPGTSDAVYAPTRSGGGALTTDLLSLTTARPTLLVEPDLALMGGAQTATAARIMGGAFPTASRASSWALEFCPWRVALVPQVSATHTSRYGASSAATVPVSCSFLARRRTSALNCTAAASATYITRRGVSSGGAPASGPTLRRYTSSLISDVRAGKWQLEEYLMQNPLVEKVQLFGEKTRHEVLTERFKYLIASLPLLIEKMRLDNYCFHKPLTLSDLMVDEFGQFVIAEGTILEELTKAGLLRAYRSGAAVLEHIIGDENVPADSSELISIMKKRRTHSYLILVHPSSIPLSSRSQAYLDAHDILCAKMSGKPLLVALDCLRESLKQWDDSINNNKLLKKFFRQKSKSTEHLFYNLRNLECHTLEHLKALGSYTKNMVRRLTHCKFPNALPALYFKLWKTDLLIELEVEDYFCLPGTACCRPGFCVRKKMRHTLLSNKKRLQANKASSKKT